MTNDRYQRIEPEADGSLRSLATGLLLGIEGPRLRLVDAATGERILWEEERDEELARLRRERSAGA